MSQAPSPSPVPTPEHMGGPEMAPRTFQAQGATPPSDSPGRHSDAPRETRGAPRPLDSSTGSDVVEALLFASDEPLAAERIREVLDLGDVGEVVALVEALRARYAAAGAGLTVVEVGGGFRMVTRPELAPWLMRLAKTRTRARLSRPALETLAIIAYKQPVSRPEVDAVRGVSSEGVLDSLLERRLLRIAGRKEAPGRPFMYETTREFLVAFGLRDLGDLPRVDGDLLIPETVSVPADGHAAAEQDPRPGGTDVAPGG